MISGPIMDGLKHTALYRFSVRRHVGHRRNDYGLTMRYLGMSMGIGIAIGVAYRRHADDAYHQR